MHRIQEEREERHKYKGAIKNNLVDPEIIKSGRYKNMLKNLPTILSLQVILVTLIYI